MFEWPREQQMQLISISRRLRFERRMRTQSVPSALPEDVRAHSDQDTRRPPRLSAATLRSLQRKHRLHTPPLIGQTGLLAQNRVLAAGQNRVLAAGQTRVLAAGQAGFAVEQPNQPPAQQPTHNARFLIYSCYHTCLPHVAPAESFRCFGQHSYRQ